MPLDSGEYDGVLQTSKPHSAPKARVSCAVKGGPLSESHWILCGVRGGVEPLLDALGHEVADVLPVKARGLGDPADGLTVAAVEAEHDVDFVAVPAAKFEGVAAPAQVTFERDALAVVRLGRTLVVASQQKIASPHDSINSLVIDGLGIWLAIENRSHPPIPVARTLLEHCFDASHKSGVFRLVVRFSLDRLRFHTLEKIRRGHALPRLWRISRPLRRTLRRRAKAPDLFDRSGLHPPDH